MKIPLCSILLLCVLVLPLCAKCPRELVNDPAPGTCGLYQDKNNDNICDRSQKISAAPQLKPHEGVLEAGKGHQISAAPVQNEPVRKRQSRDYHLGPLTAIAVALLALSEWLPSRYPSLFMPLRLFWLWALTLSFIVCSVSGLVFLSPVLLDNLPALDYGYLHTWSGVLFILLTFHHLLKHLRSLFPFRLRRSGK